MRRPTPPAPLPRQERASTGIAGLDDVLGGGLPIQHIYLVEGDPGSGKTTLGLHFLLEGASHGERGLYVTLSETAAELRIVAASHGWNLEGIELFELLSDEGLSPELEQSILHPSQIELANQVYTPSEAEVNKARRILEAMAQAAKEGKGAVSLDGRLIDIASIRMAEALIEKANAMAGA